MGGSDVWPRHKAKQHIHRPNGKREIRRVLGMVICITASPAGPRMGCADRSSDGQASFASSLERIKSRINMVMGTPMSPIQSTGPAL